MTGLLLTCLLGLSPGVQLADSPAQRHIRLVEYDPYYNMSRDDLLAELNRLDATKSSLVTPVVFLSLGGVLFISGGVIFALNPGLALATVGGLLIIGGGVFLIVGAIMLGIRLVSRLHYNSDVAAVQRRLDELQRNPAIGPDLPPPPPPPPPPPGASFFSPTPDLVVAVF